MIRDLRILLLALAAAAALPVAAWEKVSLDIDTRLREIQFVGPDTGYVFGDSGVLLRTFDAGDTWTRLAVDTAAAALGPAHFVTGTRGWVIENETSLYKTTDAGNTWTPVSVNEGRMKAVHFVDTNTGFLLIDKIGSSGNNSDDSLLVHRSTDGGVTWTLVHQQNSHKPVNTGTDLSGGIGFSSPTKGWIVIGMASVYASGGPSFGGRLLKTMDGGASWTDSTTGAWSSVQVTDSETGWLFAGFQSYSVPDCPFPTACPSQTTAYNRLARLDPEDGTWSGLELNETETLLHAAHFRDADTGYLVGDGGLVMKTVDGGAHWVSQRPTASRLLDVVIASPSRAFAVGDSGTLLRVDPRVLVNVRPETAARTGIRFADGRLTYRLSTVSEVTVRIVDASGKTVWDRRRVEAPGLHSLALPVETASAAPRFVTFHAGPLRETFLIPGR